MRQVTLYLRVVILILFMNAEVFSQESTEAKESQSQSKCPEDNVFGLLVGALYVKHYPNYIIGGT